MGTVPDALPGGQPLSDSTVRRHWERAWRCRLSPDPGLSLVGMILEAEKGNLKALYVMGENPVRALSGSPRIGGAMKNLEFLVVQDILETETSRLADVVLPGAAFAEKGGSFTNMEGRIQSFEAALPRPGEAMADWEILNLLGKRMGSTDPYRSLQAGSIGDRRPRARIPGSGRKSGDRVGQEDQPLQALPFGGRGRDDFFLPLCTASS